MLAGHWRTWCAFKGTWYTDCWWQQCSGAVPFLGPEFAKLRRHKTGPKKKVPAGVHTEDPRVTEQHVSTAMHRH